MNHDDMKAVPNQVVMMTTSHIPVALSYCHFVTFGHYWVFLMTIFSKHPPINPGRIFIKIRRP